MHVNYDLFLKVCLSDMPNNNDILILQWCFKRLCGSVRTNDLTPLLRKQECLKVQHLIKCLELCNFFYETSHFFSKY